MSTAKQGGKTRQHPPRAGKRLGVKLFGDQKVIAGNIIVRQRGSKFFAGEGVEAGRDFTLFATQSGQVKFKTRQGKRVVYVTPTSN